jgi:general secretion pathway protein G
MKCKTINARRSYQGFTLVEILIVVIILGILAAIVIPQFTNASTSARQSNLTTQLQSIQEQIAYYQLQHNGTAPSFIAQQWAQMTEYTDISGNVSATSDATHVYGPYFPTAPTNPLTATANASTIAAAPDGNEGWVWIANGNGGKIYATGTVSTNYFNPATGEDSSTAPY